MTRSASTEPEWHPTLPLTELVPGELRTFKGHGKQLVLGRTDDGTPFALDNRCPHEGYPLAQGHLRAEALTCRWHNWKFDVRSGGCTLGGEAVRRYATRVADGHLLVDVSDPDPALSFPGWLASLEEGLYERGTARAIRDGVRLLKGGFDPLELLARIALYDARHAEYGPTHALPVSADCARFLGRYPGVRGMYAIAPALDMCSEANQRLPERPTPAPLPGASEGELRAAVEAEESERAEALLRGAFVAGVPLATIEDWLVGVLSDHFLDFGHALIYLVKARELLARLDPERARKHGAVLYPALLYGIVLGTREDTLPYMSGYASRLEQVADEFEAVHGALRAEADFDGTPLIQATLDGSIEAACDALWKACRSGASAGRIAGALVLAAAERLLRFDPALDADPRVAENWLWATHRFTFASAVHRIARDFHRPDVLRLLFHALAFVHSGHRMDLEPQRRDVPGNLRGGDVGAQSAAGISAAIARRDLPAALAGTWARLADPRPLDDLREALEDLCLGDPLVRPIAVAHAIKTQVAAFEEYEALAGVPGREVVLLALVRFLASPLVERRVHETVGTSIRWVDEGTLPRKLTQ